MAKHNGSWPWTAAASWRWLAMAGVISAKAFAKISGSQLQPLATANGESWQWPSAYLMALQRKCGVTITGCGSW